MKARFTGVAVALLFLTGLLFAQAQEMDPLLKILVDNKVITQEQAVAVQAQYDQQKLQQAAAPSAAVTKEEAQKIAEETVAKAKPNLGDLGGLKIGGTYYLSYQNGEKYSSSSKAEDRTDAYGKFVLKRFYVDVRKDITPWLSVRGTTDIHQDSSGNYSVRAKYAHALFKWKGNAFVGKPFLEAGMVHTAFLDWEDGINRYRMQDSLFSERVLSLPSADLGLLLAGNFGADLPKSYQDEVSKSFPGRWGSFAIGVFNGSGYSGSEANQDKVLQARVSLRPLPDFAPGFQVTLAGLEGKGNVAPTWVTSGTFAGYQNYPDWSLYQAMLSCQHPRFTVSAQYLWGVGNNKGDAIYAPTDYVAGQVAMGDIYEGRESAGYSFFGEYRFPANRRFSAFYRHDHFDPDTKNILLLKNNEDVQKRDILGFAWWLYKDNAILFDYENLSHSRYYAPGKKTPDEGRFQITLQIKY